MKFLLIDDEYSSKLDPDRRTNFKLNLIKEAVNKAELMGPIEIERLNDVSDAQDILNALKSKPDLVFLDVDLQHYYMDEKLEAKNLLRNPDLGLLREQKIILVTYIEDKSDPELIREYWNFFPFIIEYVAQDEITTRLPDILITEFQPEKLIPTCEELEKRINIPGRPVWYIHNEQTLSEFLAIPKDQGVLPLVGKALNVRAAINDALMVGPQDISVYIHGASGTGKEALAKLIHSESEYRNTNMEILDAGSLPSTEGGLAVNIELFGTGSAAQHFYQKNYKGILERLPVDKKGIHSGTLFIDEIGEMPPDTQKMLLRVFQEKQFTRLASIQTKDFVVKCSPRIICATDRSLEDLISSSAGSNRFDDALFARVASVMIKLAPLKERIEEDIDLLTQLFSRLELRKLGRKYEPAKSMINWPFSEGAMRMMRQFSWPRNIRQLRDTVKVLIFWSNSRSKDAIYISRGDVKRLISRIDKQLADESSSIGESPYDIKRILLKTWLLAVLKVGIPNEQALLNLIGDTTIGRTIFLEYCQEKSGEKFNTNSAMEWILRNKEYTYDYLKKNEKEK